METFDGEIKKKKMGSKYVVVIGLVLVVVAMALITIGFGLRGKLSGGLSGFLPMPAARVNNSFVFGGKVNKNFTALKHFYDSQEGREEEVVDDLEIKKMALDRLVEDKIIMQLAKKFDVRIAKKDIEEEYQYVLEDYENEEELIEEIKELYDWTVGDFKDEVLVSSFYYDMLRKAYLMDTKVIPERREKGEKNRKKAEEALERLKNGEDFAKLAKEVSQDDFTAEDGGDIGWFEQDEMEPEFEEAAFSLNPGDVSDVIRTEEGYHIIKVIKKRGEGDKEEVKASHILFTVKDDFDEWFFEEKKKAKIKIYLKDIKWDKEQAAIEGMSEGEEEFDEEDIDIEDVEVEAVE